MIGKHRIHWAADTAGGFAAACLFLNASAPAPWNLLVLALALAVAAFVSYVARDFTDRRYD